MDVHCKLSLARDDRTPGGVSVSVTEPRRAVHDRLSFTSRRSDNNNNNCRAIKARDTPPFLRGHLLRASDHLVSFYDSLFFSLFTWSPPPCRLYSWDELIASLFTVIKAASASVALLPVIQQQQQRPMKGIIILIIITAAAVNIKWSFWAPPTKTT